MSISDTFYTETQYNQDNQFTFVLFLRLHALFTLIMLVTVICDLVQLCSKSVTGSIWKCKDVAQQQF